MHERRTSANVRRASSPDGMPWRSFEVLEVIEIDHQDRRSTHRRSAMRGPSRRRDRRCGCWLGPSAHPCSPGRAARVRRRRLRWRDAAVRDELGHAPADLYWERARRSSRGGSRRCLAAHEGHAREGAVLGWVDRAVDASGAARSEETYIEPRTIPAHVESVLSARTSAIAPPTIASGTARSCECSVHGSLRRRDERAARAPRGSPSQPRCRRL